ncbi:MAG: UDP-glucose--hexose-1-phosphate uridylyltransferase [Flavobacteriales bacterium]|nr:UDP-glucose--hexose-1-phosphate uridylyltransferase [Flavobacteriales bacterium]
MEKFNFEQHAHRRLNILTGQWVLVSPHRTKRPWNGKVETPQVVEKPQYDSSCQLCPSNERASGEKNPAYTHTFVFTNDFSALLPDVPEGDYNVDDMLVAKSERGVCRVVNFSPDHSLTLAEMEIKDIARVVEVWAEQYRELGSKDFISHVQIFENKGELMGNSNPHPHGQIWAQSTVPDEVKLKTEHQKAYFDRRGRIMLMDYLALELRQKERVIYENEYFVVLVPFWAVWPFETMILPKMHVSSVAELDEHQRMCFADAIHVITAKYDNMFSCSFPYSSGIHQSPTDGSHPEWQMHMSFYPPLLRSATVKKFMVGYEMFAGPQRDITAEGAAAKLRELSSVHYKKK